MRTLASCSSICVVARLACAGSPSQFDHVAAFKAKLALHKSIRPNHDAISRLLLHFPQQMLMMTQAGASPDDAMLLYKQVLAQPGTQTVPAMVTDFQIAVNGPWLPSHPHLASGLDLQSKQLLVLQPQPTERLSQVLLGRGLHWQSACHIAGHRPRPT